MDYVIGIDTGGTCTDAVLMEKDSGKIIATTKEPTTHHDLATCTANALKAILNASSIDAKNIKNVTVSSTLATNSVVENKGANVALLVIGYVKHFKLPVKAVIFIKGGHNIMGQEEEPLDISYLVDTVNDLKNEVDAFGVCSAMSIKDPTHELVAEQAISMIAPGKPVFCSHQVSNIPGMKERAATAGLHAKLMPIMQDYMAGINKAMLELQLTCPLKIVAGNTDLVEADHVVRHAGLTVASGPACTAYFGANQTDEKSLVIDIGGTTTDIVMVDKGKPIMSAEGGKIGSWQTHVESIDMSTAGIGGDSHVKVNSAGKLEIGPIRVTPLALAKTDIKIDKWLGSENESKLIIARDLTESKNEILSFIQENGPATAATISEKTKYSGLTLERELEKLEKKQTIIEEGFTPTDALHVLGKINIGEKEKALLGAKILGKLVGLSPEEFAQRVIEKTQKTIQELILDYVFQHYWGNSMTSFIKGYNENPILAVQFGIKIPLIGIGAIAKHLIPGVADLLNCKAIFPEYCEVGNAVGAASLARKEACSEK
ncbi:MAG: hydantoinase/oxoprolinase family protein [Desulfotalea sp.]